jgi:hypothetical protein
VNYTWHISKLGLKDQINQEGQLLEDAIVYVHWKKIAEDTNGTKVSYVGETELSASNVSSDSFINLNLVSKEDVISWVENSLSKRDKENIEKILLKKIEKSKLRKYTPSWG